MNPPQPVHILWVDAVHRFGWHDGHTPQRGTSPVETLGYLLAEDEDAVVVCQSWSFDSHAQSIEIPRGMIRSMRPVVLPSSEVVAEQPITRAA